MATNTVATRQTHTAANNSSGNTSGPYAISFDYLDQTDVEVRVANVLKTQTTHYTFPSKTSIQFTSGNFPTVGAIIEIKRNTDITTPKVDFEDGSVLTETDLDNNSKHLLFGMQETKEDTEGLVSTFVGASAPTGSSIVNGARWYDTVSGRTFIYYVDADTAQWVEASPPFDAAEFASNVQNSNVAANAAIAQSKLDLSITNSEVNSSAAIDATKLAFTQTGTGAVARTVSSKLNETISVKDFGAVGNGTNNDATAIQAAIDSASDGGVIYFPEGTYLCNAKIETTKHVSLIGEGPKSTEIVFATTDGIKIDRSSTGERDDSILIKDLSILCKTQGTKVGLELVMKESAAPKAAKVAIYNCNFHGFDITNINTNEFEWLAAIKLNPADKAVLHDVFVYGWERSSIDNYSRNTKGIELIDSTGVVLYKCDIYRVKTGLRITGQSEGIIALDGAIVAVDVGIHIDNPANPANNHSFRNVHIAAEQYGIDMEANTNTGVPSYNNISNCFFLQRITQGTRANNSNLSGMTGYMAIRLNTQGSTIDNCSFLSNISPNSWQANTAYAVNDVVQVSGRIYKCTVAGTSHASNAPSHTSGTASNGTATFLFHNDLSSGANGTVDAGADGNRAIQITSGSHNHISNITSHRSGTTIHTSGGTDNYIANITTDTSNINGTSTTVTPNATDIVLGDIEGGDDSRIVTTATRHVFKTQGGEALRIINGSTTPVNSLEIFSSDSSNNMVTLRAKDVSGSNPNQDIKINPTGTGKVRFGTHTASSDAAVSGYITIKDAAGNLRKLAVIS